ncbi:uncharacterized protein LOC116846550 isoform X2 [Odontomachus brunneus]|uniref:uncharacterized protein LOC116846550 isoform X2 n=1 Tax=Odontomachus brunneus TaxID=486640 RepID=UPI0013F1A8CE|nr:uncharacterized protein LOC116846550 isoform X2 [Odontomachus brunneus]
MANNDIDDILARLDEIKKLQAELRHLVPRVASNSSRAGPQDLTSDTSASIRFPSLVTFPGVSSLSSSSTTNGRVQKSAMHLNLSSKLSLSDNRPSTASLANAWRSTKTRSSVKETNAFRDSPRSAHDVAAKSLAKNSIVPNTSTSAANSTRITRSLTKSNTVGRIAKHLQGAIRNGPNNETASADKTPRATLERSNLASKNRNHSNANIRCANLRGKDGEITRNAVVAKKKSSS